MNRIKWPSIPYGTEAPKGWMATEKMDGENTTMTREFIHARSVDSKDHESRHWVKGLWSGIRWDMEYGLYIVGENLFAKHSIHYVELPSYFMVFATLWASPKGKIYVNSWDATKSVARRLGLEIVPEVTSHDWGQQREGTVFRNPGQFLLSDIEHNMMKMVRPNHVQTDDHWFYQPVVQNLLKDQ